MNRGDELEPLVMDNLPAAYADLRVFEKLGGLFSPLLPWPLSSAVVLFCPERNLVIQFSLLGLILSIWRNIENKLIKFDA